MKLEDISECQWAGASAQILLELMDDSSMTKEEIKSYLRYTAQMSDYLQTCEPTSVMLLDEEHRTLVAKEPNRAWDDIDPYKSFFYLKKKDEDGNVRRNKYNKYNKYNNYNNFHHNNNNRRN